MVVYRKMLILLTLGLVLAFGPSIDSKAVDIKQGISTSLLIREITDNLEYLIGRAEETGDFLLKRSAQEGLYIIDGFKKANQEILNQAFTEISEERRAFLNALAETTKELSNSTELTFDRAESMLDQVDRLARALTFKDYPVIFRYRGSVVVPGDTQNVRLSIDGVNLTEGDVYLELLDETFFAARIGESLLFEIPRKLFIFDDTDIISETAKIGFVREGGFFSQEQEVLYDLNIVTLPQKLGSVKLTYKRKNKLRKEKEYSFEVSHNSSNRRWHCRPFSYSPAKSDRRFDPDRSSIRKGPGNKRGKIESKSIRDVGISFRICAKRKITDRGNGFRHAYVKYTEVWYEREEEKLSERKNLIWTEDLVIKAEGETKDLIAQIDLFTGRSYTFTSSGQAGKYANVRFDADQNLIIVKPKVPEDIDRL